MTTESGASCPLTPSQQVAVDLGVLYQIYPRSFLDADGDGIGDLAGLVSRLDYLHELGVDAVWLTPIYPSPMRDGGYDVSDYLGVDPAYGTLQDLDSLIGEAHARTLGVVMDFVPNHTSDLHPWFVESRSSRASSKRDWYVWANPGTSGGPPNNWWNHFDGGPAWTFDEFTGQYYLHLFSPHQPDLNWRNPAVESAMFDVLRFWLDRGVDGFRVDVPSHLLKDAALRDEPPGPVWPESLHPGQRTDDLPQVHEIIRRMRAVLDEYGGRCLLGELWLPPERLVTYYGTYGDEFHVPFNLQLIGTSWDAATLRGLVEDFEALLPDHAWPNWVMGNHDRSRVATRLGSTQARVAMMALLTLRGTPTIYYGDELGLPDLVISAEQATDPQGATGVLPSRDPARAPMPWDTRAHSGFSPPAAEPWLPTYGASEITPVAGQHSDPTSMLNLTRALLRLRRSDRDLGLGSYASIEAPPDVFAFTRADAWTVVLNLGQNEVTWPFARPGRVALSTHMDRTDEVDGIMRLRPDEGLILRHERGET